MSLISINKKLCSECGICVLRCSNCFHKEEGRITVTARDDTCNSCGHCVALCPTKAITHKKMDMDNFTDIKNEVIFESNEFIHFIRSRRSHRFFKDKKIPRTHLEMLTDLCRYAPTGNNSQNVEILIIQDQNKIKRLSNHTIDFFENNINELIDEEKKCKANQIEVPLTTKTALSMLDSLKMLVDLRNKNGFDEIFYQAPVVIIFHAPSGVGTPKDDCIIAATTMTLAARTLSLESCYIGIFEIVANRYQPIVNELSLPPGHNVFSVLILGFPSLKYFRTVDRKPMMTRWF